jgi:hypothetical protein
MNQRSSYELSPSHGLRVGLAVADKGGDAVALGLGGVVVSGGNTAQSGPVNAGNRTVGCPGLTRTSVVEPDQGDHVCVQTSNTHRSKTSRPPLPPWTTLPPATFSNAQSVNEQLILALTKNPPLFAAVTSKLIRFRSSYLTALAQKPPEIGKVK